jgi:Cdc6-like AAA superfamily ATPase
LIRTTLIQSRGTIQDVKSDIGRLNRYQDTQENQQIISWLSNADYAAQLVEFSRTKVPGTGQWLLESDEFHSWEEQNEKVLFCPGIPGSGKTILTSIVVEYLQAKNQNDLNVAVLYVFCSYTKQQEQTIEHFFASMLQQLVQSRPELPESIKNLYSGHSSKKTRPSTDEVIGLLRSVASGYSKVFILIDALDECTPLHRRQLLDEVFKLLSLSSIQLFATSRMYPDIMNTFKGKKILEIQASEEDVRKYLSHHVKSLTARVQQNIDLQNEIITKISGAIKGMYVLKLLCIIMVLNPCKVSACEISSGLTKRQDNAK